jgi:isoquinoline 1-oxidoreductase beta subunit
MSRQPTATPRRSRRRFLFGGLGAAGALIVGWGFLPPRQRLNASQPMPLLRGEAALNGWIKIREDGTVTIAMPRSEMGQGVHTTLATLVAEELDVPLARVRLENAPDDKIFGNVVTLPDGLPFHPDDQGALAGSVRWLTTKLARELGLQITGGSTSMRDAWLPMREAGASARAMLVAAAAKQWGVDPAECATGDGMVRTGAGGKVRSLAYGALAAAAAGQTPGKVTLKLPAQFTLIGRAQPRTDSRAKSDGSALFGLDVRPAGLQYAAVAMAPSLGAKLVRVDAAAAKAMPGVVRVVDFSKTAGVEGVEGVAVIATSWWQARQAVDKLQLVWDAGTPVSSAGVAAQLKDALDKQNGYAYYERGDLPAPDAGRRVQAEYSAPFLAHATMEPVNCTAQVGGGKATVWTGTQVPGLARRAAAMVAGLAVDDLTMHLPYLGGGFGRRLEIDMVRQAVAIARDAGGAPVQVIWTREQDIAHDMYRPAALARFDAALDPNGKVLGLRAKSASGSIVHQVMRRTFGLAGMGPDKTQAEGAFDQPYEFPAQRYTHVNVESAVPLGFWRSVGHSHNAFFTESFVDELAHAAGKDPALFRRALLARHPRHQAVLDAVMIRAGEAPAGRAHGVALHDAYGSVVAQVAEVSVEGGEIRVHKVWCAIDCGLAVNPDVVAQQMESGIVFGLSAALYGRVTFDAGRPQQSNFHDYPVLRMDRAPAVETIILPSANPPEGVGEAGTPPVAPAVANAVFKLTGKRLRALPLTLG